MMHRKRRTLNLALNLAAYAALGLSLGLAMLCAAPGLAQSSTSARLTGEVTDPSGAAIPNASITAVNTATNYSVTVTSDGTGNYAFNSLPVGPYKVTTTLTGFAPLVDTGIVLTVGQSATLNLPMKLGNAQDTVTVTGGAEIINTTTAELSQVVDEATIKDLPLNGRDPGTLVFLSAGVTNELNSQASTLQQTNSFPNESGASAGGQRQGSTWYLLDGVSNMDTYTLLSLPFPNPDATQEFRVISNNFDARNGFAPSAIVSIQTKSGSNQLHGGVFEFIRNDIFNAKNPFSGQLDRLKRNQFGGYVGGPVVIPHFYDGKDKLFFFTNYQGTRQRLTSNTNTTYTPTAAERAGDFSALLTQTNPIILPAPFVNDMINPSLYSPGAVALLKDIPVGQNPVTGQSNYSLPNQPTNFDEFTERLDYNINDKQRIFIRSFQNNYNVPSETIPNNILAAILGSNGVYLNEVVNHTWTISPKMLNTFAVGYVSYDFHTGTALKDSNGNPICLSQFINVADPPNACYLEDLNVEPGGAVSPYAPAIGFSSFSSNPDDTKRRDISATETFTETVGNHTISAGVDLFHRHHTERSAFEESPVIGFNGQYTGVPFADFLLGYADSLFQGAGEAGATSQWMFGIYGQDQWKIKPNLTLTLGLRWDPNTPAHVAGGRGADFVPGQQSTRFPNAPLGLVFPGDQGISDTLYNSSYSYFEPRIGIAWAVSPTTTVRSAFGLFTTPMEDAFYQRVWDVAPFSPGYSPTSSSTEYVPFDNPWTNFAGGPGLTAGQSPFPPFAGPQQNPPSSSTFGSGEGVPATFIPNLKLGVTQSWNLSLEQQFTKSLALHLAYVGSESYHQATTVDRNPGNPGVAGVPTCTSTVTTGCDPNRGLRFNPAFGGIIQVQDGGTASYSALQAGLEKKFSHGFQFQSNFTWSRTTDVGGSGDPDFESSVSDPFDIEHDKGLSSLNVPIVWVTYGLYHAPTLEGHSAFVRNVLGGWEVSAIFTTESGEPFTINGGNGNNNSGYDEGQDRADVVPGQARAVRTGGKSHWLNQYFNPAAFAENQVGTPGNSGKYMIQEPPVATMDAAAIKNITFGDRYHMQFRWEAFNALNHPSYGQPDNNPTDSNFGQISGIGPVAPRVVQAALKLTF